MFDVHSSILTARVEKKTYRVKLIGFLVDSPDIDALLQSFFLSTIVFINYVLSAHYQWIHCDFFSFLIGWTRYLFCCVLESTYYVCVVLYLNVSKRDWLRMNSVIHPSTTTTQYNRFVITPNTKYISNLAKSHSPIPYCFILFHSILSSFWENSLFSFHSTENWFFIG